MYKTVLRLVLAGAVFSGAAGMMSGAQITLGQNAIANGDAESGAGSSDGSIVSVPGWTSGGQFTAVQYGAGGGFPSTTDPGPASRGSNFFAGGPSSSVSTGTQMLDVSNISSDIDSGLVNYVLSGYLGGFETQGDNATLTATFVGTSGDIGSASIGPVTEADRNGLTGLLFRTTSGVIPAGTIDINFVLSLARTDGSYDDGYADNLSFVATSGSAPPPAGVPEPTTAALLLSGCGVLTFLVRRRSRQS